MKGLVSCLLALISVGLICSATSAQTPVVNETFKLFASDGAGYDWFGYSVSISGDTAIVGAYQDDDNGSRSGSAYIYRFDGSVWNEEVKLLASDGVSDDYFGSSVSISGDTVIVGMSGDDDSGLYSGSAYIYRFDGSVWNEEAKLLASDGAGGDWFGVSVSISSDTVIVGSFSDDDNGSNSGSAYIYRFDGSVWNEEVKLLASDGADDDRFGWKVSIANNAAIVAAQRDDDNGSNSGSAYAYRFDGSTWIEEAKLLASDGASNDEFGDSVSISGDIVIVGATNDDENGSRSGSAYIYRFDGSVWIEETKLLASDGVDGDSFGRSVSISGDTAIVGAYRDHDNGSDSGSAYSYRFDGSAWIEAAKLLASDGAINDLFGISVSISGDRAIVGAYLDNVNDFDSGSAYFFDFDEFGDTDRDGVTDYLDNCYLYNPDQADCNFNGIGDVCDLADGTSFDCDQNGIPDECQQDCNGNGVLDACDISDSTSFDCDQNGIPDECQQDCNGNGVLDSCDISDGTEEDCDGNGVPDSCDIVGEPQATKLLASDGVGGDLFGTSVSLDGDTLIVGAKYDNDNGIYSGSAYIYYFDGLEWIEETKLLASDGVSGDIFGQSVFISGDTAIVGAYLDYANGTKSGSAYIYRFDGSTWIEETKLIPSDGQYGDNFGISVSISGDTAIVGARNDDDNSSESGSAYIYRFDGSTWIEEAKLLASDGAYQDYFGLSVSISGNTAIVGSYKHDDNGIYSGSAYIYYFDGLEWIEETKLLASDGTSYDHFGSNVSISDDTVIVGSYRDNDNGTNSGSAYIYRFNGEVWTEETKLLASDGVSEDHFGLSVSISGDTAIVGSYKHDDNGTDSGSAYIYHFDGSVWIEEDKLVASDGVSEDSFGLSVSISGDTAIVGSYKHDDNGTDSGSAYIYMLLRADDCNGNGIPDACELEDPENDQNNDGVLDDCECSGDADGDGSVNVNDILIVISNWGSDSAVADLNTDGIVNVADLLIVIGNWGGCG